MAYDLAMLVLAAVGIVPGFILATFAVAGVCFPNSWLGKKTRAPFSPGTPAANIIRQTSDAAQRTADEAQRQTDQQALVELQGVVVADQQN